MTTKETKEPPKCRAMMYTQQVDRLLLPDWKDEIQRIVSETQPLKWAGILHDKDTNEDGESIKAHIHLMLYFKHARSPYNVAWEISGKMGKRQESQIERLEFFKHPNNGYSYLVHQTSNAHDKYQYAPEDVFSNFDFTKKLTQITKSVDRAKNMKEADLIKEYLDLLYEGDLTLEEIEDELTGSQYAKAASRLKAVSEKRQHFLIQDFITRMKKDNQSKIIIYLYGKAGSGKTRLAKYYAQTLSRDYFITGSSRDPFQGYNNQEIVIIDELRHYTFRYDDLLKILDPYNFEVMIPSRYFDKALTAHTIFITSPYSPRQLYNAMIQEGSPDGFEQLDRRIDCVIWVNENNIFESRYNSQQSAYIPNKETATPNPFQTSITPKNSTTIFQQLTTSLPIEKKESNNETN